MKLLKRMVPEQIKQLVRDFREKHETKIPVSIPYKIYVTNKEGLKDQIAVVTGGSGAIGRSVACHLAAEGATVYVCGMNVNKIDKVVSEILSLGGKAFPQKLNVLNESDIVTAFSGIARRHGRIDILVQSAGGSARNEHAELLLQKSEVIDFILNVNLRGVMLCSREVAKVMVPERRGKIINLSSVIGLQGKANFAEYAAAKGGVIAFTKSVAMELGQHGITVNCVSPGIVQRDEITESRLVQLRGTNWMSSYGKPEDIAAMVLYLASERANFITGQNFIVDGGRSLGLKGD